MRNNLFLRVFLRPPDRKGNSRVDVERGFRAQSTQGMSPHTASFQGGTVDVNLLKAFLKIILKTHFKSRIFQTHSLWRHFPFKVIVIPVFVEHT